MRIKFLAEAYVGGIRTHLNMLMGYLLSQGFSVELICSSRNEPINLLSNSKVLSVVEDVTAGHRWSLLKRIVFVRHTFLLSRQWQENDIIHAHGFLAFLTLFILKLLGLKNLSLVTLHGGPLHHKGLYQKLLLLLMPIASQYITRFVCVSDHDRSLQLGVHIPESSLVVIENAIDIDGIDELLSTQSNPFPESTKINLVIVSTLYRTKGVWELLCNLDKEPVFDPNDYCLYLIGSGPQKKKIDKLITNSSYLSSLVLPLGHINAPYNYLQWADIVLFPSRGETFGLVLFEALYIGAKVLAHRQPVTSQYLEEAYLTDFDDMPALKQKVEALRSLASHDKDYSRLLVEKRDCFFKDYHMLYLSFDNE